MKALARTRVWRGWIAGVALLSAVCQADLLLPGVAHVLERNEHNRPEVLNPKAFEIAKSDSCFRWFYYGVAYAKYWAGKAQIYRVNHLDCSSFPASFTEEMKKIPAPQCANLTIKDALKRNEYQDYLRDSILSMGYSAHSHPLLCEDDSVTTAVDWLASAWDRFIPGVCQGRPLQGDDSSSDTEAGYDLAVSPDYGRSELFREGCAKKAPVATPTSSSGPVSQPSSEPGLNPDSFPKEIEFTPAPKPKRIPR
jgi:hypothetical protein